MISPISAFLVVGKSQPGMLQFLLRDKVEEGKTGGEP